MENQYEICLAGYESVLPKLAEILGASYTRSSFETAEEEFHNGGAGSVEWKLAGAYGTLVVNLERYEGYYFCRLEGQEPQFQQGKELLWKAYLAQGGNPRAQQQP